MRTHARAPHGAKSMASSFGATFFRMVKVPAVENPAQCPSVTALRELIWKRRRRRRLKVNKFTDPFQMIGSIIRRLLFFFLLFGFCVVLQFRGVRPCWMAKRTRPAKFSTPSFCIIRLRYVSTVFGDRCRTLAIATLDFPSTTICRICRSRGLRLVKGLVMFRFCLLLSFFSLVFFWL